MIDYISDIEIYERVICGIVPKAKRFLWISTADLKDMYVVQDGRGRPFLQTLSSLISSHVEIRLLHAKEPGVNFRNDFDRYPNLIEGMERILCPRVHFKSVIVDGEIGYIGSANLTGAGMGAKSQTRRNFEGGIISDAHEIIDKIAEQFDTIWRGDNCRACQRKQYCADYKDMLLIS
ncbi:MAG: phospholipase [Planctomycetes bacterium]|nr:phospholipase [Planctomycetota bacterium]